MDKEKRQAQLISSFKCFLLDMDGTFYLGDKLLDGSMEFINRLRQSGKKFAFLTNNSSKSYKDYRDKLSQMGVDVTSNEVITSGQATIGYLLDNFKEKSFFLLGNESLTREFAESGIRLTDTCPDVVVTAFDTTLDYRKMCMLCDFVRNGLPYIATHPDYNCPTETGFIPDIGAIHAFVHASTGRWPDKIIGKPNREIVNFALGKVNCDASHTAMVGDRLYTDIACARNVPGLTSILVLTGETRLSDLDASDTTPDIICTSLSELTPYL